MATIYALTCAVDGKAYVGCTRGKMSKRMREHRCLLRANKHAEPELQAAWNTHGESAFSMIAVRVIADESVDARRQAELQVMQQYDDKGLLYNRNRACFSPTYEAWQRGYLKGAATKGNKQSPEANAKRRAAQIGKPKGHGAKISATKKALGQKPSLEAARLGGIAATRKRWSQD